MNNDSDIPQNTPSNQSPSNNETHGDIQPDATEAKSPSGHCCLAKWSFIGGAVIVAAVLGFVYYKTPYIVSNIAKKRMTEAGLANPKVRIDNIGPFYAEASGISFSGQVASVSDARGQAGYSPADVALGGPVDTATVEDLHAVVDVDKALASSKAGKFSLIKLPFMLPKALADIPARSLLVRGAKVDFKADGEVRKMSVDTLSRQSKDGTRSATFSIAGENGDQFIIGVEGHGTSDTISAEGSIDILGWFIACNSSLGVVLPEKVGIESAPLVVQCILNESGHTPGKWVCIVSQPWFQYEKGPLAILMQDARAGFTGEKDTLKKAAAEADFKMSAGSITIGPFHPVASANSKGDAEIRAESIPVTAPGAQMKIDYAKVSTNIFSNESGVKLRGTLKPSWFPNELEVAISVPSTIDGVFVDLTLPSTKLGGVTVPAGWLPKIIEGLKVSGMVNGELNVTAGGMTANGCDATGRLSASDATFILPVGNVEMIAEGVRVDDARVASLTGGFSIQLPKGIKANSLTYGKYTVSDLQVWPCRITLPGDANIGSSTFSFMGGRVITSAVRGTMASDGSFVPTSQFEISASGLDLSKISAILPGTPGISGSVDIIVRVNPPVQGAGIDKMRLNGSIKSPSLALHSGADSFAAENLSAEFEYDGANENPSARIKFIRPMNITAFNACGVTISGSASLDGWVESSYADITSALTNGLMFAAKSSLRMNLSNAGLSLLNGDISVEGVNGALAVEQDGKNPRVASDGEIEISSIKYRTVSLEKVAIAFAFIKDTGLSINKFKADFCNGTLQIKAFSKAGDGYKFKVSLENISAASLAAMFPSFKGKVEGRLDGELSLKWEKGELTIYPGSINLKPSSTGRFSYSDPSVIMKFMKNLNENIKVSASHTIENMIIKVFTITVDASSAPIKIHIVGDGVDKSGTRVESEIPIDAVINIKGDVADAISAFISKNVKVRFAKE